MAFGQAAAEFPEPKPTLVDGLHQNRLAPLPAPGADHRASQPPVEQPPLVAADTAPGRGHRIFTVRRPSSPPDTRRMVIVGMAHAVDKGQRQRRLRPPHVTAHLPLVGAAGAMSSEEPVKGRQEIRRRGIAEKPGLETIEPLVEVGGQTGITSHEASKIPEGIGRNRRIHVAQPAKQGHQVLAMTTRGPSQGVETDSRAPGDR